MKVRKAVITAAAPDQPRLPFQSLVDKQGKDKTALQLIVEEVIDAGIEDICIVIRPGDRDSFSQSTADYQGKITFVEQDEPQGYADGVLRAESFVGEDTFLHLVGDHIYLSRAEASCAAQLVKIAESEACAVSAVQATRENLLSYFGTVGAARIPQQSNLFEVNRIVEKPSPTQAEQELVVAGLRAGFYLCISGMHVLPASFFQILKEDFQERGVTHISDSLNRLSAQERYLAFALNGTRFNIGVKYGLLRAQLELALAGADRDQILTELVEMLALQNSNSCDRVDS